MLSIRINQDFLKSNQIELLKQLGAITTSIDGNPHLTVPAENTSLTIEEVSSDHKQQTYRLRYLNVPVCTLFIEDDDITPKVDKSAMDTALKIKEKQNSTKLDETAFPKSVALKILANLHNQLSSQVPDGVTSAQITPESIGLSLAAQSQMEVDEAKIEIKNESKSETKSAPAVTEAHFHGGSEIFLKNTETGGIIFDLNRLKAARAESKKLAAKQKNHFSPEAIIAACIVAEEQTNAGIPAQRRVIETELPTPANYAAMEDKQFYPGDISQADKANLLANLALEYQALYKKIHQDAIQLGLRSPVRVQFWHQRGWTMFRVEDDHCDTDPVYQALRQEEFLSWLEYRVNCKRDLESTGGNLFNLPTPGPILDPILGDRRERTQNAFESDQNRRIPESKDTAQIMLVEGAAHLLNAHLTSLKNILGKDIVEKAVQALPLENMSDLDVSILQVMGVIGVYPSKSELGQSRLAIGQLEFINLLQQINKELLIALLKVNGKTLTKEQQDEFNKLQDDYAAIKNEADTLGTTEQDVSFSMTEHQPSLKLSGQSYAEAITLKNAEDKKWEEAEKIRKAKFEYVKQQREKLQLTQDHYFQRLQHVLGEVAFNALPDTEQRNRFGHMQADLLARTQPRLMTCISDSLASELLFKLFQPQPHVSLSWDGLVWNEKTQAHDYALTVRNHYPKRVDKVIHICMDNSLSMLEDKEVIANTQGEKIVANRSMLAIQLNINGTVKKNAGKEGRHTFEWAIFPARASESKEGSPAPFEILASNVNGNDAVAVQGMIETARSVNPDGERTTLAEMLAASAQAIPSGDDRHHEFVISSDGLSNSVYPEVKPTAGPLAEFWENINPLDLVKIREIQALHKLNKTLFTDVESLCVRVQEDPSLEDECDAKLQELEHKTSVFAAKHQAYQQEFIKAGRLYRLGGNPSDEEACEIHWSIAPLSKKIAGNFAARQIKYHTEFQYHIKAIGKFFDADAKSESPETQFAAALARQELSAIQQNLGNSKLNTLDTLTDNSKMLQAEARAGESQAITGVKATLHIDPTFDKDVLDKITGQRARTEIATVTNSPDSQTHIIPHAILQAGAKPFVTAMVEMQDAKGDTHRFTQRVPREFILHAQEAAAPVKESIVFTAIKDDLRTRGIDMDTPLAQQFRTATAMRHTRMAVLDPLFRKEQASAQPNKEKLAEYEKLAARFHRAEARLQFNESKSIIKAEETGIDLELKAISSSIKQDEKRKRELAAKLSELNSHITDETVMHTDAKTSYSLTLAKTTRIEKEGKLAKLKEQLDNAKNKRRQLILRQPLNDLLTGEGEPSSKDGLPSFIRAMRTLNRQRIATLKAELGVDEKQSDAKTLTQFTGSVEQLDDLLDIANSSMQAVDVNGSLTTAIELQVMRDKALLAQQEKRMLIFKDKDTKLIHQRVAAIYQLFQILNDDFSPEAQLEKGYLIDLSAWLITEGKHPSIDPNSDFALMVLALSLLIKKFSSVNGVALDQNATGKLNQSVQKHRPRYRFQTGAASVALVAAAKSKWIENHALEQGMLHDPAYHNLQTEIDDTQNQIERLEESLNTATESEQTIQNLSSDEKSPAILELKRLRNVCKQDHKQLKQKIELARVEQTEKAKLLDDVSKRLQELEEKDPDEKIQLDPRAQNADAQHSMLRKLAERVIVAGSFARADQLASMDVKVESKEQPAPAAVVFVKAAPLKVVGIMHSYVVRASVRVMQDESSSKQLYIELPESRKLVPLQPKTTIQIGAAIKHIFSSGLEDFEFVQSQHGELVPATPATPSTPAAIATPAHSPAQKTFPKPSASSPAFFGHSVFQQSSSMHAVSPSKTKQAKLLEIYRIHMIKGLRELVSDNGVLKQLKGRETLINAVVNTIADEYADAIARPNLSNFGIKKLVKRQLKWVIKSKVDFKSAQDAECRKTLRTVLLTPRATNLLGIHKPLEPETKNPTTAANLFADCVVMLKSSGKLFVPTRRAKLDEKNLFEYGYCILDLNPIDLPPKQFSEIGADWSEDKRAQHGIPSRHAPAYVETSLSSSPKSSEPIVVTDEHAPDSVYKAPPEYVESPRSRVQGFFAAKEPLASPAAMRAPVRESGSNIEPPKFS